MQRPLKQMLLETESHYIRQVLEQNGGDVDKTAAVLQISRSGLYKKLQREKAAAQPIEYETAIYFFGFSKIVDCRFYFFRQHL